MVTPMWHIVVAFLVIVITTGTIFVMLAVGVGVLLSMCKGDAEELDPTQKVVDKDVS
jgi:hypothetical protein